QRPEGLHESVGSAPDEAAHERRRLAIEHERRLLDDDPFREAVDDAAARQEDPPAGIVAPPRVAGLCAPPPSELHLAVRRAGLEDRAPAGHVLLDPARREQ